MMKTVKEKEEAEEIEEAETPEEATEEAVEEEQENEEVGGVEEAEVAEEETEEAKEEELEAEEGEAVTEAKEKVEEAKKEEKKEEIVEERIYTIPLGKAWISPREKRTPRATRLVKIFINRHMKPKALLISNEVNEKIWRKGIEKPPRRIRVRAAKDSEGTVTLYLAEEGD